MFRLRTKYERINKRWKFIEENIRIKNAIKRAIQLSLKECEVYLLYHGHIHSYS